MEELKVLIESTMILNRVSAWFDLPITETEFKEALGIEVDSENYRIIDKDLPFANEVDENTPVERLNELALMYQNMPVSLRKSYASFVDYYSDFDEFYNYRNDIIYYENCNNMIDVAQYLLKQNTTLKEDCLQYIDYEAYAQSLEETRRFVKSEYGIFEIPW